MGKKIIFYCDMDDVLVDFTRGYFDLTGEDISGRHLTSKSFWSPIDKAGLPFWVNLHWTSDGKELWEYIKKYTPKLLSAPSIKDESRVGKHQWVKRELPGTQLILRSAEHKKDLATPNSILIDDRADNVEGWVGAKGIGILHVNTKDTIKQLKKLGL